VLPLEDIGPAIVTRLAAPTGERARHVG
jgi:hypothetical protein